MPTQLIVGGRRSGKTSLLLRESAKTGIYILVANRQRALELSKQAKDLGYNIPFPITLEEYFASNRFVGNRFIREKGIFMDDADDIFGTIFSTVDIKAATITRMDKPTKWIELDIESTKTILYFVCPDCGETIFMYRPPNDLCPKCGGKMYGTNQTPWIEKENPYLNKKGD